jgi:uncharacterized protein
MTMAAITGYYAALLALLLLALSIRVIQARLAGRVALGMGNDDRRLLRASRAQGNFVEYVPIILVMLLVLEMGGAAPWLLHLLGSMTLAGRIAHGLAISREPENLRLRQLGMGLTFTALIVAAVALLLR